MSGRTKARDKQKTSEFFKGEISIPGLENTVAPPKAPSKILIGVNTNRGPISTNEVAIGPFGTAGSFSIIWCSASK